MLSGWFLALILALAASSVGGLRAETDSKETIAAQETKQIAILKSKAPPQDKALACKRLAIYGGKDAVPALAPLLADAELASWARIALEAIPDPSADAALLKAAGKVKGELLVGTINSIGVRRNPKAVGLLISNLRNSDPQVASAAAIALGHIGGDKAATALQKSLADAPAAVQSAVAEGCVLCAERYFADGKAATAVKLYDAVRTANVPKNRVLEATRGAILARQSDGLPLLLEELRSSDKAFVGVGLSTARELPGPEVTRALVDEMDRCPAERKGFLLLAIADRHDPAALPTIYKMAQSGPTSLRLVAVGILDRQDDEASLPVLLNVATDKEPLLKNAAISALARLSGPTVNPELLAQLPKSSGTMRVVLLDLAAQRRLRDALPIIVTSVNDSDKAVRTEAVQALGILGTENQTADLVKLLQQNPGADDRANLETALVALSGRAGARCVPQVVVLETSEEVPVRIVGLHALASAGGNEALRAVKAAVDDKDETVQDEAVRTLSTWPNNWPEDSAVAEPLLELAKSGKKTSHQVLGQRGYLQFVQGDKQLKGAEKVAKVKDAMAIIKRPEEQRQAIAILGGIPTAPSLDLLIAFADQPAVAGDACSAIVQLAGEKMKGVSKTQRDQALQTVVAKAGNDDTKKKAEELLKKSE